jgi:hypothetical protein
MRQATKALGVLVLGGLLAVGCSGLSSRQERTLSGGAIGAGAGAGISAISGGDVLTGSAVGAAAGALGGLLVDESQR